MKTISTVAALSVLIVAGCAELGQDLSAESALTAEQEAALAPSLTHLVGTAGGVGGPGSVAEEINFDLVTCTGDESCWTVDYCGDTEVGCHCLPGPSGTKTCQHACLVDEHCGGPNYFCWKGACKPIDPAFCYKPYTDEAWEE